MSSPYPCNCIPRPGGFIILGPDKRCQSCGVKVHVMQAPPPVVIRSTSFDASVVLTTPAIEGQPLMHNLDDLCETIKRGCFKLSIAPPGYGAKKLVILMEG